MNRALLLFLAMAGFGLCPANWLPAQGRHYVELEIHGDSAMLLDTGQKWTEVLSEVGADSVRLTQATGSSKPDVQKSETGRGASYKIVGILSSRNQLILPGGRYSIRDTAKIKSYVDSIRADGAEVALAEKMAFGLTAQQLVALHDTLKPEYPRTTIGTKPAEILNHVKQNCGTPIVIDPSASGALRSDYTVQDELRGLSQGTALAAALRPLGLVMAPRREQGGQTEIIITDTRRAEEHWPIGWPLQQRPSQAIPKLYERIPVNIRSYTLKATLTAIQGAMDVPFLFDYNSMAQTGVDLEEIRVNLEAEKLAYQLVLQRILAQARPRMEMDLRADENGKAFVWLSSR